MWSHGATLGAVSLATSLIPQPCGLFSCTLSAVTFSIPSSTCQSAIAHKVTSKSALRSLEHLRLKICVYPEVALLADQLAPASVSFPQVDSLPCLWAPVLFKEVRHLPSMTLL